MEDRRIRKTKKPFYNALIELLKKNEIRYISVQELCDLADSHRSTFYYHYSDIYALYEEMETKILDEFSSVVSIGGSLSAKSCHLLPAVQMQAKDHCSREAGDHSNTSQNTEHRMYAAAKSEKQSNCSGHRPRSRKEPGSAGLYH